MNELSEQYKIEVGIILEKFYYTSNCKISIPSLTPLLPNSSSYSKTEQLKPKTHLINKSLQLNQIRIDNWFSLKIPTHILSSIPRDEYGYVSPGIKLLIAFIGGDLCSPKIIGVY